MKRAGITFILIAFCSLFYQNCGVRIIEESTKLDLSSLSDTLSSSSDYSDLSTGDLCEDILLKEYLKRGGYYDKLKSIDCAACHADNQNERPKISSADPLTSWAVFSQKELEEGQKISENMTGTHQNPNGRIENSSFVENARSQMNIAIKQYSSCSGQAINPFPYLFTTSTLPLKNLFTADALTSDDLVKNVSVKGTSTGLTTDTTTYTINKYQRLVYDKTTKKNKVITLLKYNTEDFTLSLKNGYYTSNSNPSPQVTFKFNLIPSVSIMAAEETISGVKYITNYTQTVNPYFTLKKPSFNLDQPSSTSAVAIQNMSILIDNTLLNDATVYKILTANICTTTTIEVMKNASEQLVVLDQVNINSVISFQFQLVTQIDQNKIVCTSNDGKTPDLNLPSLITYSQLADSKSEYGVLAKNCFSCHSGASASATLDLTDYNQTKAKAARIQNRMNDFSNPMPSGGVLGVKERAIVDIWVSSGLKN